MKLETTILPRRDGTVTATLPDGTRYPFVPDHDGTLSCDVANDDHAVFLLDTGMFYPGTESDMDTAIGLMAEGDTDEVQRKGKRGRKAGV